MFFLPHQQVFNDVERMTRSAHFGATGRYGRELLRELLILTFSEIGRSIRLKGASEATPGIAWTHSFIHWLPQTPLENLQKEQPPYMRGSMEAGLESFHVGGVSRYAEFGAETQCGVILISGAI